MDDITQAAIDLVNKYRPYVDPNNIWTEAGSSVVTENAVFINAKKCAMMELEDIISAVGNCSVVAGYPLDYYKLVLSVITNMEQDNE